jgi:hypothetical protein
MITLNVKVLLDSQDDLDSVEYFGPLAAPF